MAHFAEYTEGIALDGVAILKDGHTMFPQDIVRDLNCKSYLEQKHIEAVDTIKKLAEAIEELTYPCSGEIRIDLHGDSFCPEIVGAAIKQAQKFIDV